MRGSLISGVALIALASACEPPIEPIFDQDARVVVHSILDPSADTQKVVLSWTTQSSSAVAFSTATVRMTAPDGRVQTLALRQPGNAPPPVTAAQARFIMLLSQSWSTLQRGGTYKLDITVPGRDPISGTTKIPDAAFTNEIFVHTLPFTQATDTLRLKWPRVPGAAGYRVMSTGLITIDNQTYSTGVQGVFTDTSAVLAGTKEDFNGSRFFPIGYTVDVTVLAVDDNYFTYYKTAADPFAGAPPSRLSGGAIGVFGSVVPIHRRRFRVQ